MKVTRLIEKDIDQCWEQCPYYTREGNMMVCDHPKAPDSGLIITTDNCRNGFPPKCPLLNDVRDNIVSGN